MANNSWIADNSSEAAGSPIPVSNLAPTNSSIRITYCKPGFGYPIQCPRESDNTNYTKCCKYYNQPECCLERSRYVCALRGRISKEGWDIG